MTYSTTKFFLPIFELHFFYSGPIAPLKLVKEETHSYQTIIFIIAASETLENNNYKSQYFEPELQWHYCLLILLSDRYDIWNLDQNTVSYTEHTRFGGEKKT